MKKNVKVIISIMFIVIVAALVYQERRLLIVAALSSSTPPLSEATAEVDTVIWFDDYFTIEYIDSQTIAIGEPRYHQKNYNYLIIGQERAILFDTGPGIRDIKPVVESLTSLPIIASQSHLHYDHVGNHNQFNNIALPDLHHLRSKVISSSLPLSAKQHLGFMENIDVPVLSAPKWWVPGANVDLGGRILTMIHAPGHTPDSIVLFDRDRKLLFTGDFIYPGPLFAMVPGSDLNDYLSSSRVLIKTISPETRLLAAHGGETPGAPILAYTDLLDLQHTIEKIIAGTLEGEGEGLYFKIYPVNDKIDIWVD